MCKLFKGTNLSVKIFTTIWNKTVKTHFYNLDKEALKYVLFNPKYLSKIGR